MENRDFKLLNQPLELPCGSVLKNRIIKAAMSDSLGDGRGNPTDTQIQLYKRWANGGAAALIIGEVQFSPHYAEKPGNLVLRSDSDLARFKQLATQGAANNTQLWLQLAHAGAMAYPPISTPAGPSAINLPSLRCAALTLPQIQSLPSEFAHAARLAQSVGFNGVEIHAAHGFLLSQFLSPLFNQRNDDYGGSIEARMRLLLEVIDEVRATVDPNFVVAVKLNASDQIEGGLEETEALSVVRALNKTGIDLIDISGGTYFPGAKSASDAAATGPYFQDFSRRARACSDKPLLVTGGFKTIEQSVQAIASRDADLIGLARALALDPNLPNDWFENKQGSPVFPTFSSLAEGGLTAWYTMRLTQLGEYGEDNEPLDLSRAIKLYEQRDRDRITIWNDRFRQ